MIETCGWCKHFKEHKSKFRFAGGWWLGDGKCKYKKATVTGDTCEHWESQQELNEGEIEEWLEENWQEEWCHPDLFKELVGWLKKFYKDISKER